MSYDYIQKTYAVSPRVGQSITVDGKRGVITRPRGNPHYLRVRFDGQKNIVNVHPTWRVVYVAD